MKFFEIKKYIFKKRADPEEELKGELYNVDIPKNGIFYKERDEVGCKNFLEKTKRKNKNQQFEWPNMIALNQAIACFIKDSKKIVNIGSGTGTFEWFVSVDPSLDLLACELDKECVSWCIKNRKRNNIKYCMKDISEVVKEYKKFDLGVCVDVVEHIYDYPKFLKAFSRLADKAIITTPNRDRDFKSAIRETPEYYQHVREWNAGEFYWILRCFYKDVRLYSMQDQFIPQVKRVGFLTTLTPLIAVCNKG